MIVILGLIIVVAVVIVGVAGVLGNGGSAHALPHGFAVLGYHVTGSTGTLFLSGMVVGAVAVGGLILLLAGARRTARRGRAGRRRLQQSRRETAAVSQERDDLIGQREAARADTASAQGNGSSPAGPASAPGNASAPAGTASGQGNGSPPAGTASGQGNGSPPADRHLGPGDGRWSRLNLFGRRSAPRRAPATRQAADTDQESLKGQPAPDLPAGASAPAE